MNEGFISYLWQFQYFVKHRLATTAQEGITVFVPGILNRDAGPDYSNARVRIGDVDWVGSVEIHIRSSGWLEHRHQLDPAYENVVLHVVWEDDRPIFRSDGTALPTLELKQRVEPGLLQTYRMLVQTGHSIPCSSSIRKVEHIVRRGMVDRVAVERLETKAQQIAEILLKCQGDWQQTAYVVLARNFGFSINGAPFQQLAESLPLKLLLKHADKPLQQEALLFGQAGFLDIEPGDEYYTSLRKEYHLLDQKYSLASSRLRKAQWKLLRLRPANFPAVRISQFAALVGLSQNVFAAIFQHNSYESLRELFRVRQSPYWTLHYQFNRKAKNEVPELGESSIDMIFINSVAPLLLAYGKHLDMQPLVNRAIDLLNHIPAEHNSVISAWGELGVRAETSFDSQGILELNNNYCRQRNCLNCNIGSTLLKPEN